MRIGDTALRGAATATLDFAKDRRGDYILAGDEVVADAGDGIDTYEVLKVLTGNKVKIGGLGVEVATVDAKTVSIAHKHGILKRDGDTVVLKNAKWQINYFDGGYDFVDAPNQGDAKRKAADMEKKSGRGVRSVIVAENYPKPYKDFVIRSNSTNPVVANAIAANFSARAKQSGSNAVRNLEEAHKYLDDVVNELMKSDDPNDAKLVEQVKKLRKDVNAVLWKAMSIR